MEESIKLMFKKIVSIKCDDKDFIYQETFRDSNILYFLQQNISQEFIDNIIKNNQNSIKEEFIILSYLDSHSDLFHLNFIEFEDNQKSIALLYILKLLCCPDYNLDIFDKLIKKDYIEYFKFAIFNIMELYEYDVKIKFGEYYYNSISYNFKNFIMYLDENIKYTSSKNKINDMEINIKNNLLLKIYNYLNEETKVFNNLSSLSLF